MGCYAAINALKLARHIVRSEPRSRVLVVNLELCTLHLQETGEIEQVLCFLIFADGCTAGLVTAEPAGSSWRASTPPGAGSADQITWRIGDAGFDMTLSGFVPHPGRGLPDQWRRSWRRSGGRRLWAVHPGGRSVLDAVDGLSLPADALDTSRAVLRDYGNMSSATVMFVLERMLRGHRGGNARLRPGLRPRPLRRDHAVPRRLTMRRRRDLPAAWIRTMGDRSQLRGIPARLRDLGRINRWSLAYRPTLRWLDRLVARTGPRSLSVLDVGAGGGDMLRAIAAGRASAGSRWS